MNVPDIVAVILKNLAYESIAHYRDICREWNQIILRMIVKPFKRMPFDLNHSLPYTYLQKIKLRHILIPIVTNSVTPQMCIDKFFHSLNLAIKHFPHLKEIDL